MPKRRQAIMCRLPFGDGLTAEGLAKLLAEAGYKECGTVSLSRLAAAQQSGAAIRDRLRTMVYARFAVVARVP